MPSTVSHNPATGEFAASWTDSRGVAVDGDGCSAGQTRWLTVAGWASSKSALLDMLEQWKAPDELKTQCNDLTFLDTAQKPKIHTPDYPREGLKGDFNLRLLDRVLESLVTAIKEHLEAGYSLPQQLQKATQIVNSLPGEQQVSYGTTRIATGWSSGYAWINPQKIDRGLCKSLYEEY